MKIKFKKILKWSLPTIFLTIGAFATSSGIPCEYDKKEELKDPVVKIKDTRPDITVKYDTVYLTKEYLDTMPTINLGLFWPSTNSIIMKHFIPADTTERAKNFAETHNSERASILRHELEHGRKAHLWNNISDKAPFVRGQIACMNEVMAPASEVIESAENEWLTGKPTQGPKRLKDSTAAILEAHKKSMFSFGPIDFSNQQIADIVLKYAIDKYISVFNRGAYKWTVRKQLDTNRKYFKYKKLNKECDPVDKLFFRPESGDWSQLFTYKTKAGKKVNIWKSASQKMRDEVQQRVDSATMAVMRPGEYLTAFKIPEKK